AVIVEGRVVGKAGRVAAVHAGAVEGALEVSRDLPRHLAIMDIRLEPGGRVKAAGCALKVHSHTASPLHRPRGILHKPPGVNPEPAAFYPHGRRGPYRAPPSSSSQSRQWRANSTSTLSMLSLS